MVQRSILRRSRLLRVALLTLAISASSRLLAERASPLNASQASAQQPSPEDSQVSVQQDVSYGTVGGHALLLDVYEPRELISNSHDLRPAVVLIHGGSWTGFDKSTMERMGMFLSRSGFVAFSVDYRLFQSNGKATENAWPAQLDDVQRAVRWIRANAEKYHVDPNHMGAFGHSAGAQLASLLGLEGTRDNSDPALAKYSSTVQAVVDVSGPTDFTVNHDADGDAFLMKFLGGDYAHHSELWRDASPAFHVSKQSPPFLIFHGTQDQEVPIAQAQELADKLKQAGDSVEFVKVDDVHTFRTPEAHRQLAIESRDFFFRYLNPHGMR
jgi:acetyl esterase/lipase